MTDAEKQIREQVAPIVRQIWAIARVESLSPAARYAEITEQIVDLMLAQQTALLEDVALEFIKFWGPDNQDEFFTEMVEHIRGLKARP